jgi:hypothetical protein
MRDGCNGERDKITCYLGIYIFKIVARRLCSFEIIHNESDEKVNYQFYFMET